MAFLHAQSCECLKSELLLFETPPTQTTIENSRWVTYKPISSLTDDSPIEFVIPPSCEMYTDLAHTMLSVKVTVKQTVADTDLSADAKKNISHVGPVNNFMHSLFSQVDVSFNQKQVSPPNNTYAYRAYIETLLNYGYGAKNSHLSTVLWSADSAGNMDDCEEANEGLVNRRHLLTGKSVDMVGHLHCDVFNQEKLLLNGVEIKVRLIKAPDNFVLMDPTGVFRVNIDEANLLVRRVKISPTVQLIHEKTLMKSTAKYPLTRVEVKAITLHSGVTGESLDNIILGQLPKRIVVGFVENKAFNGDKKLNPFNFKNWGINFLSLYIDGVQTPSKALEPDFARHKYVDAYLTLFTGTGIHFLNDGNDISREDYPNGYCLFAFDLTPDLSANELSHWNLIRHGSVRLEVRFASPLTTTVNCVVYAEFENILEIDASRQILIDFTG